jgi:hypothetical protein
LAWAAQAVSKWSSITDKAILAKSGDRMPPYEQCWVMRSAGRQGLVTAILGVDHCA